MSVRTATAPCTAMNLKEVWVNWLLGKLTHRKHSHPPGPATVLSGEALRGHIPKVMEIVSQEQTLPLISLLLASLPTWQEDPVPPYLENPLHPPEFISCF